MVIAVLHYDTGEVSFHYNVPEGKEEEYIKTHYKESQVNWMSIPEEKFVVRNYKYSDVIKYVN